MKSIESPSKKNLYSIVYPFSLLKASACYIPKSAPTLCRAIPKNNKRATLSTPLCALPYIHNKNHSYTRWLSSNVMMKNIGSFRLIKMLSLFFILILCQRVDGQVEPIFIQLEDGFSKNMHKFFPGHEIQFTTKEYPDAWRKEVIERIIPEGNTIVLSEGFLKPSDISKIKAKRKVIKGLTNSILRSAQIAGFLIKKLFRYKTYDLDQKGRLRIMDIRFTTPDMLVPMA